VSLLAALRFLTALPVPGPTTPQPLGRSVAFFPFVGLLLGLALVGLDTLFQRFLPALLAAVLLTGALVLLTGALHLDGLADAADGLLAGRTPEDRLRIMRDPAVGSYGAAAVGLVLLMKATAIASLNVPRWPTLLIFPVLGRWAMAWAIAAFPYGRDAGLGSAFKASASLGAFALASLFTLVPAFIVAARGFHAWVFPATIIIAWATVRWMLAHIPGLTGDCYGALNETVETAVLVLAAIGDRLAAG
jgi:adenosylcobinamide-GDP ribazoletransferase